MEPREELKFILETHYSKNWNIWTNSPACYLNEFELLLIEESLSKKTLKKCAGRVGVRPIVFMVELIKLIHKLKLKANYFDEWSNTFYTGDPYSNKDEKFLNIPIHLLPLSHQLKQWLFYTHQRTLKDLMANYSELDLIVLYNFPDDVLFELKTYLGSYQSEWFGKLKTGKQKSCFLNQINSLQLTDILKFHLN